MLTVRPFRSSDAEAVRNICVATDGVGLPRAALLALYCDYYIEQEPQHCFVLADVADVAVGYILCAADFAAYRKRFRALYYPKLRRTGLPFLWHKRLSMIKEGRFSNTYPAHLHIDILAPYQGGGHGGLLMDALLASLKSELVRGVMLGVGSSNRRAVRFYERCGFEQIGRAPGCYYYGFRL